MHIQYVEIGNFRKLRAVRIDMEAQTTIFVGANNSGKTSAMVALRRFLVDGADFSLNDFTLSHWTVLNAIGASWEAETDAASAKEVNWHNLLPHLDLWLNVPMDQVQYIQKILPTIEWEGGHVGVRLRYEPKDIEALKRAYLLARNAATAVMSAANVKDVGPESPPDPKAFALWPKSMVDFFSRRLRQTFEVRAYLLDPAKLVDPKDGEALPQELPVGVEPIAGDPFDGLIRIDEISAQRGFGSASASGRGLDDEDERGINRGGKKLSSQLRSYYTHHLDPFEQPEPKDLEALQALHNAQSAFGTRLESSFSVALKELEDIGYPGVTDPKLTISTDIKPVDGLVHASAVRYEIPTHLAEAGHAHRLPEDSNGLGYQNLISMVFALMSFRDKWMRVGKASKSASAEEAQIAPLHLVLIEEPEAHLHAQVQQVFIAQAYAVLRKHDALQGGSELKTQLVVSTHSSHLVHEAEFTALRYFRRLPVKEVAGSVPIASVVNLSQVFGTEEQTARFVKRYLKVTHCDLLFADGAILVEGPSERILLPHLVRKRAAYEYLRSCYITWLEIGGSHAHRLKPLLMHLGLNTLIITDIDAKDVSNKSVPPLRGAGLKARNETLRTWIPKEDSLDLLLDTKPEDLVAPLTDGYGIRVAYQQPINAVFQSSEAVELLANTFEDALVYANIALFKTLPGAGLIDRVRAALTESAGQEELAQRLREALVKGGKAEFAMDLLDTEDIDGLTVPAYIDLGLKWLVSQLKRKEHHLVGKLISAAANEAVPEEGSGSPEVAA